MNPRDTWTRALRRITYLIAPLCAWLVRRIDGAAWFATPVGKSRLYVKPYFALDGKLHTHGMRVAVCVNRIWTEHYQDGEPGARSLPFTRSSLFPRLSAWNRGRFLLSVGYALVTER